ATLATNSKHLLPFVYGLKEKWGGWGFTFEKPSESSYLLLLILFLVTTMLHNVTYERRVMLHNVTTM
ncbi:MAG: hypothetical protein ACP5F8_03115, partial [Candidatus Aenigmatarchaeota archaeon]